MLIGIKATIPKAKVDICYTYLRVFGQDHVYCEFWVLFFLGGLELEEAGI